MHLSHFNPDAMTDLSKEQLRSIKKSYFNILALFLGKEKVESRYLRCLLKWGVQLHLNPEDLRQTNVDLNKVAFSNPDDKVGKLESIYHLVYMIYLDKVVEDVELEVASIYAQQLGFDSAIVSELFKSIATADYDEIVKRNVRQEVMDFMKIYIN
jgi:hypothetical protein